MSAFTNLTWAHIVKTYDKAWEENLERPYEASQDQYCDDWYMLAEIPRLPSAELVKAMRDFAKGHFASMCAQMWKERVLDEIERRLTVEYWEV
jgi:hypothetical protein